MHDLEVIKKMNSTDKDTNITHITHVPDVQITYSNFRGCPFCHSRELQYSDNSKGRIEVKCNQCKRNWYKI